MQQLEQSNLEFAAKITVLLERKQDTIGAQLFGWIVSPDRVTRASWLLPGIPGKDVRVQIWIGVAINPIVYSVAIRDILNRLPEQSHVTQENHLRLGRQIVQTRHERIGQDQRVSGQALTITEYRPTARYTSNHGWVQTPICRLEPTGNATGFEFRPGFGHK